MNVYLRNVSTQDVGLLRTWLTSSENAKWLAAFFQAPGLRDEQLALFLFRRDRRNYLLMCDGVPVGIMGLTSIDDVNRSAEIWSVVGNVAYRRRGLSTVGFRLALRVAFDELGLRSVNAWAVEGNHTIRIFEKLGFNRVGVLRQCHLQDGQYRDRILFDLLREECIQSCAEDPGSSL